MVLKLTEFVEKLMMAIFWLNFTQFEKTGSIGKTFISLGYLINIFHFRNYKSITLFMTFTFCCSIVDVAFILTEEMH